MLLTGIANEYLSVGSQKINTKVYSWPDITGFIIGIDWREQQGKFVWDFHKGHIQFGNG